MAGHFGRISLQTSPAISAELAITSRPRTGLSYAPLLLKNSWSTEDSTLRVTFCLAPRLRDATDPSRHSGQSERPEREKNRCRDDPVAWSTPTDKEEEMGKERQSSTRCQ